MKIRTTMAAVLLAPAALLAGPAEKVDPVAAGYPVWTGVTPKNFVLGRELCASDLRHKLTIVVEVDAAGEKFTEQLIEASGVLSRAISVYTPEFGSSWENFQLPRNNMAVLSVRNLSPKAAAGLLAVLTNRDKKVTDQISAGALARLNGNGCSIYRDLSFEGAPDTKGKYPYFYVFGPTGAEPLVHGPVATAAADISPAVMKARKEIGEWSPKWRPFFGNIGTPKFNTSLAKALEKGKKAKKMPLDPVAKALLTDVKSSDAEKAKEAQILFDAINQTRSDLVVLVGAEAAQCPHRAYYDVQQLLKYWPAESKRVATVMKTIETAPNAKTLGEIFAKLTEWADPSFCCKNNGEVKANLAKLQKMKKMLSPLKESQNILVQNAALLLDGRVDECISQMPSKVETK